MLNKYTLSLSPNYVSRWKLWEAVRELLQNAIDQNKVNPESEIIFDYTPANKLLVIGNTHCKLGADTLLLGCGEKRFESGLIGQHGEGYKLALLVLTRLSFQVRVLNDDVIWTPKFERSEEYGGESVLNIYEEHTIDPVYGVYYQIRDVTQEMFGDICENYLAGFSGNHILDEGHLKGKIFVSGLFVCKINDFAYGYCFEPDAVKLDRDRCTVSSWDAAYEAGKLWSKCRDRNLLYANLSRNLPDFQYVQYTTPETNRWITDKYLTYHGEAVPVSSNAEIEKCKGTKIRLVPEVLKNIVRSTHEFCFNRTGTPKERLERFGNLFGEYWNDETRREFAAILEEAEEWT